MRAPLTALLLIALLGLAACDDDDDGGGEGTTGATDDPCEEGSAPEPRTVELEPPPKQPSAEKLTAVVDTSCGTFEIALDTKESPKTVASFEHLAENGVYNDTLWHRIVPGFVIQGGDPRGDGSGGPGYTLRDEVVPRPYLQGAVGIALAGKDTGGSQFFITLSPQPHLDGQYTLFGRVAEGMDVVRKIRPGDTIDRVEVWTGR